MVFKKIGNWFSKNANLTGLLESKIVLYGLVLLAIFNLYVYTMEDDLVYAVILLIVGFLSSFFNKNMIIILFTAIAFTNIIRYCIDMVNPKEGFTGNFDQLDNLMEHLTNDKQVENAKEIETKPLDKKDLELNDGKVSEDFNYNAELNRDPNKRDEEIDKMIRKLNPGGVLKQLEGGFDIKSLDLAKDKINLALKYTDQIAHEEQRKGVIGLLKLQEKMMDKLLTIAPLIDEFREVVKQINL